MVPYFKILHVPARSEFLIKDIKKMLHHLLKDKILNVIIIIKNTSSKNSLHGKACSGMAECCSKLPARSPRHTCLKVQDPKIAAIKISHLTMGNYSKKKNFHIVF